MPAYRVYRLDLGGRVVNGHWMEADCDETAKARAAALCEAGIPAIEIWLGARRVGVVGCDGCITEQPRRRE